MFTCVSGDWPCFCGGVLLWQFKPFAEDTATEGAEDILIRLMDTYCSDVSSFVIADTTDGIAGHHLFSKLDGLQGEVKIAGEYYDIGWALSSPFLNANSGNEVQILTAWKIYKQDFIDSLNSVDDEDEYYDEEDDV